MAHEVPTILVTGVNGQVGFELQRSLSVLGRVVSVDRRVCELTDRNALETLIEREAPHIIVNPAAYTAVDKAESEPEAAHAVNAVVPAVLAEIAARTGTLLVQYSTDYVFNGDKAEPYTESDVPMPRSVYGRTKLAGEEAIRDAGCPHLIFRTSWVFGEMGGNFLKTMLRLAKERDALRVVADQWGAPTPASLIADVTAHVLARYLQSESVEHFPYGTYHLTSAGFTNWYHYACAVIEIARARGDAIKVSADAIHPISSSEYPVPACRPQNSRLSTEKLRATFGLTLPDWRATVSHVMNLSSQWKK